LIGDFFNNEKLTNEITDIASSFGIKLINQYSDEEYYATAYHCLDYLNRFKPMLTQHDIIRDRFINSKRLGDISKLTLNYNLI
jgi:hypothetical protein